MPTKEARLPREKACCRVCRGGSASMHELLPWLMEIDASRISWWERGDVSLCVAILFSFHSSIHHLASGRQDETSTNNVIISISHNINVLSQTNNYCVLLLIVSYLFHVSLAPQFHKVFKFSTCKTEFKFLFVFQN
jgi:hypothetical protein